MTKADLYQLVDQLPDDVVASMAMLLKRITSRQLDPDQMWVWSQWWQDQLRASFADLSEGRTQRFETSGDLLASM